MKRRFLFFSKVNEISKDKGVETNVSADFVTKKAKKTHVRTPFSLPLSKYMNADKFLKVIFVAG